ncbi:discoidin domain-containing protein [Sphingobacterium olei]|uniref:Discoidin domain-containing protein n=1 Tax=Sphingobacterium olei TaxID=2571155 RepID=A0A4U0NZU0_9SPHI|nr:discoidin domain-containing protein [Sphingobacterium olei]TJZ59742.1 discoidin domain-containing protein [Sphingobacterium olei]
MRDIKLCALAAVLVLFFSCVKDTLTFPEKVVDDGSKEPIDVIAKPTDVKVYGDYENRFTFKWPVLSNKIEKVKISYTDGTEEKEVIISDFSGDFLISTSLVGEFEFKISSIATDGRETGTVTKKATNKGLYINDIIQFTDAKANGFNVILDWTNPLEREIEVSIIYESSTGQKVEKIQSSEEKGEFSFNGKYGNSVELQMKDSFGNMTSKTFNYGLTSVNLTSAAQKAGWSAAVSSNQSGDGGGAPALIDGAADTFWHSPWSGTILPWPHHATITLDNVRDLGGFILSLRHNNGSGAPRDIDFQTSTDGTNFVTRESFLNTSTTNAAVISFDLATPVETKYVRLVFKTSINNLAYMSLGEISLTERVLEIH